MRVNIYMRSLIVAIIASLLTVGYVVPIEAYSEDGQITNGSNVMTGTVRRLIFEENRGQTDKAVKFHLRGPGYQMFLTKTGAIFSLETDKTNADRDRLEMKFEGSNPRPNFTGKDQAITKTNFYTGKKRYENIPNFHSVSVDDLYDGISAVYYGNAENQLEYDFIVEPNADPSQIRLSFDGAESVSIIANGDLSINTANTELTQRKPVAFQTLNGERKSVDAEYFIDERDRVSFVLGEYDRTQPLTIDPVVSYLTYVGGTGIDDVFEIAADAQGNAYISGTTDSLDFHGEIREDNDATAAYVAKINPAGTAFDYITILEGNGSDFGAGIAINQNGEAFVTGTASRFFPTTPGAFDTVHGVMNGGDAFIAKLNSAGGLVYSSFLGGTDLDEGFDVAVDSSGKAYVVGSTNSNSAFPTKNRYQSCGIPFPHSFDSEDAFLTVMNASGSDITYSSCIGNTYGVMGLSDERAFSVSLDASNNAYVTGITNSNSFKVKNAFQPNIGGGKDGWVAKFNPAASGDASVVYATFLGGSATDQANAIAVTPGGQAVIVGVTGSVNFPLVNAFRSTNQVNEAFVTVLSSTGNSLVGSSFLGGSDQDTALNVAVGNAGLIYVTGQTLSNNFPMALPFQANRRGLRDAFVTKLRFGTGIMSSSFLGGNGNDAGKGIAVVGDRIFVAGEAASNNLFTTTGSIRTTFGGGSTDGFVARILDTNLDSVGVFRPGSTFALTQSITNIVSETVNQTTSLTGQIGVSGDWNGDGIDTIGSFSNGIWKYRNSNFVSGYAVTPVTISFGLAGDLPVVGDWNGDGIDTLGVFRPSSNQFLLTNSINAANVDITINFGLAGDLPIGGDWNGDGIDTVGVFRPSDGTFFLTNQAISFPKISIVAFFGIAGDQPIAGDWDGNGIDTIGVSRPSSTEFFLSNDNINIDHLFQFGAIGDQPIVGDWDGLPIP